MSKISTEIQPQRFELIRDKIAEILAIELTEQNTITGNDLYLADIWLERFIPFDKTELPAIDIFFQNADYDENTPVASKGANSYIIEVITAAKHTDILDGDKAANMQTQRLLGVIRTILQHPVYYKLDFTQNFIYQTQVESLRMSEPRKEQDGTHTTTGQLLFTVNAEEYNKEMATSTGDRITTNRSLLSETEKGFKIELNQ